jgi:hypothetical protein
MNELVSESLVDITKCPECGSLVKDEGSSLHCWHIEYECGYRIWGVLDTKTHGDGVVLEVECSNIKNK